MANRNKREPKDTVRFYQTADGNVYKKFYRKAKRNGVKVQDRVRHLMAEDVQDEPEV